MAEEEKNEAAEAASNVEETPQDQHQEAETVEQPEAAEPEKEAEKVEEPVAAAPEEKAEAPAEEAPAEVEQPQAEAEEKVEEPEAPVAEATNDEDGSEPAPAPTPKKTVPTEVTPVNYAEVKPLDDFDWGALGKSKEVYSAEESEKMEAVYSETLNSMEDHEVVEGRIVALNKKEAVINIDYKSEGIVPVSELRYDPDIKVGDQLEVYIENLEDATGQLTLSHKKALQLRAWERVNEARADDTVVKGYIKCRTKGGLIVDVFGLEAFLPGSQIDVKPIRDYDQYVGKNMEFKVVKINQEFKNVVVSHKALIEAELELQKAEIMKKLEKGQVLEGVVKNITSYGVFIDLGCVDGLVHITDLSWGRINHPEEVVELDQKLNVVILDFDDEKKRIALGMKQLQAHPWDGLDENMKVGDNVTGKVVVLADYGAFVEIAPGVEGLIHVSEMSWSQHLRTAQDFFKVGDSVEAVIMTLDREERKMSLSTRRLTPDPWDNIESKYPVESRHTGRVTNLSNFGVFVELEEGIDGLIHISDLSWSKKINHPSEFTKAGENMEVVVLEIDKDNRRLSLGHKQLEENPWNVFETVFTVGSVHQGTVLQATDKGYVVSLPYGVEGFCPSRHGRKEDGSKLAVDNAVDFEVLEFNKDSKKIILSHARLHEEKLRAEAAEERKSNVRKQKAARKAVKDLNENMERTTLGDLDALSALKEQMEQAEKGSTESEKKDEDA